MRLQVSVLAATFAAAATYNFCKLPAVAPLPAVATFEIAQTAAEPDDDLTLSLRQQALTAMRDLQARRGAL